MYLQGQDGFDRTELCRMWKLNLLRLLLWFFLWAEFVIVSKWLLRQDRINEAKKADEEKGGSKWLTSVPCEMDSLLTKGFQCS